MLEKLDLWEKGDALFGYSKALNNPELVAIEKKADDLKKTKLYLLPQMTEYSPLVHLEISRAKWCLVSVA